MDDPKRPTSITRRIQVLGSAIIVSSVLLGSTIAVGAARPDAVRIPLARQRPATSIAPGPATASLATIRWKAVSIDGAGDAIHAVAVAARGTIAVGDERGVLVGAAPDALRRHRLRGSVKHLDFVATGENDTPDLLVATDSGLYRVNSESVERPIAPAPGARAATVGRITAAGPVTAIATADGVFLSRDGNAWQRLSGLVPSGPASSVGLVARGDRIECWAVIRGQLWRVEFAAVPATRGSPAREPSGVLASVFQPVSSQAAATPIDLPSSPGRRDAVDIVLGFEGAEVAVVFESAIALGRMKGQMTGHMTGREHSTSPSNSNLTWEVLRPDLPPGASIVELVRLMGRYWLATDRGLFHANDLRGPWRLASGPFAARRIEDLAVRENDRADTAVLYVATDRGLMVGMLAVGDEAVPRLEHDRSDPRIDRVHRAALDYLALEPRRIADINRGLDFRGWLPTVGFSVSRETDRSHSSDLDEAFLSGSVRELRDSDRDRSTDLELRLLLSWDLGDIAYHPERLDISREAREVIELRDEVLDEVTQLYFERQRVLAELQSLRASSSETNHETSHELLPLEIRAEQLAAGIDAWTGGWFSRQFTGQFTGEGRATEPLTQSIRRDPDQRDLTGRHLLRDTEQAPSPVPNPPENNFP